MDFQKNDAFAGLSGFGPKQDRIGRALYKQVKAYILEAIKSGQLQVGSKIPSEPELMKRLGVSRMTVNRAMRELAAEGYLVRTQGVGTFVSMHRSQGALIEVKSIDEEIACWGGCHYCKVLLQSKEKASRELSDAFGILRGSPVFHSVVVHFDGDIPILFSDRYVNPSIAPHYLEQDFQKTTPTRYLVSVAPIEEAEHTVEASIPDEKIRTWLKMKKNEPCLILHRKTWSFGMVATNSKLVYPGLRYRLKGRFKSGSLPL